MRERAEGCGRRSRGWTWTALCGALRLCAATGAASAPEDAAGPQLPEGARNEAATTPEGARTAIGWAVGTDSGGWATILHTTDGGQTWERQGPRELLEGGALMGVSAVSAREAWVAGYKGVDGLLLHTRDGGLHWFAEGDPADLAGNGLAAVSAVDIYTAWAVGLNGLILHTTDGGDRWVRQGVGQVPDVLLQGLYPGDASHAWIAGTYEEGRDCGTILYTDDAGETWTRVPYTVTHTPPPDTPPLISVHGAHPDEVWVVGRDQIVHARVTRRGFVTEDQTPTFINFLDINGVYAVDRKTVWAVADTSVMWRSLNGGKSWKERYSGPKNLGYVLRVWAWDATHVWVTTADQTQHGQVLYTADGGKNWVSQTLPADPEMWGIDFVR